MDDNKNHNSLIINKEGTEAGFIHAKTFDIRKRHKAPNMVGLHILLEIYYKGPAGLTQLSRVVQRTVGTIQDHVSNLMGLGLINYQNQRATLTSDGYKYIEYYRSIFNGYRPE